MCVSPIKIPNPNYHSNVEIIKKTTDTLNTHLLVPCGVCPECLMSRQINLVQRSKTLSLDHYLFFCTLTYNRQSLPKYHCSTGVDIPYADVKDVQLMMKRIRKANAFGREFVYYFVSERGKKGRPHFHGLIFIPKYDHDDKLYPSILETSVRNVIFHEWKRNYGSNRVPIWKPLFSYRQKFMAGKRFSNFDLHYVVDHSTEKGSSDVAFYVTKYILKGSDYERRLQQALKLNLPEDEYFEVWSVVKSRSISSKGFGYRTEREKAYVKHCAELSVNDSDGLKYFNADGTSVPISKYYRKKLSPDLIIKSVASMGGPSVTDDRSIDDKINSLRNGDRILSSVKSIDISEFYPD